jgi:hypothetical protein
MKLKLPWEKSLPGLLLSVSYALRKCRDLPHCSLLERPAGETIRQRRTFDQLEHDVELVVVLARVEDGDEVRVGQPREHLDLALEALPTGSVPAAEDLDGDAALEQLVADGVDRRHPAGRDQPVDAITVPE